MAPQKKPPEKPSEKDDPTKKTPEKKHVPGWDPVSDDEKDKAPKKSRRKKKGGNTDEPSKAGPSSTVASSSSAQTGKTSGPSVPKSSTSMGTMQTPASTSTRQPMQAPNQPATATPSATRPVPPSAQTGTRQADQAMMSNMPTITSVSTASASGVKSADGYSALAGSNVIKSVDATGDQSGKASPITQGPTTGKSIEGPNNTPSQSGPSNAVQQQHQGRPGGTGTRGGTVLLSTNYFRVSLEKNFRLYRYSIQVWPEAKGKKLAQMIKDALDLPDFDGLRPLVSDFAAVLLSTQPLPDDLLKVSVPYKKNKESQPDTETTSRYYVTFDFTREVDVDYANKTQVFSADQDHLPIVQDLDIVFGHHRKSSPGITVLGKRRAFQTAGTLSEGLPLSLLVAAVRGYFSSVRLSAMGILLNMNVTHGTFYRGGDLETWLQTLRNHPQVHDTKVPGLIKGIRVRLLHLTSKTDSKTESKTVLRTISGFASPGQGAGYEPHPPRVPRFKAGPRDVCFFEYKPTKPIMGQKDKESAKKGLLAAHDLRRCGCGGSYTSVSDYFKRKYPSHQVSNNSPVVNVGSAEYPSYLPLSACAVVSQPAKVKLSSDEMTHMKDFAVRPPSQNAASINDRGFQTLGVTPPNQNLLPLGVKLEHDRVTLQGRVLPQPSVMFRNKKAAFNGTSKWNLGGIKFNTAYELKNWACLNIHFGNNPSNSHQECLSNFVDVLNGCGIVAREPHTINVPRSYYQQRLEDEFKKLGNLNLNLLLVVLPEVDSQIYNSVKLLGDVRYGIQTVCVAEKFRNIRLNNFTKKPLSIPYNASVALKVNIKNGGINQKCESGQLGFISEGTTMVIGIDVTHPSPGSGLSAASVAAMVASSDKDLAQWPAEIRINPARQEKVDMLRPMLLEHLKYWKEKHGEYPEKLLIYRDGVSEGQYQMVLDEELPQLRAACRDVCEEENLPRITLIIVGKRHHTRFYRTINGKICTGNEGKDGNPTFGTVVDTAIVDQQRNWDFFIQSHTALQGTARPAHYFVLVDEIFRMHRRDQLPPGFQNPSDYLYSITYNMCYLFCRATTSVSIPPPVFYADLACERGRRWNNRYFDAASSEVGSDDNELQDRDVTVHRKLQRTMFYI